MKLNKIMTYLLISQMILSLVGCGTSKENQKQIETQQEVSQVEDTSEVDKNSSQSEASEEVDETSSEIYKFNPDLYEVYLVGKENIDSLKQVPQFMDLINVKDARAQKPEILYTFVVEQKPAESDDRLKQVKIIDKETGEDIIIKDSLYDFETGGNIFGDFDRDEVSNIHLITFCASKDYDLSNLEIQLQTNGSRDLEPSDISEGFITLEKEIKTEFNKESTYFADSSVLTINGNNYFTSQDTGVFGDSENNIEYRYVKLIDINNINSPKETGLTTDDLCLMDRETLGVVEIPEEYKFKTFEKIDDGYIKLYYGFEISDILPEDKIQDMLQNLVICYKGEDGQIHPMVYTHQFLR